MIVLQLIGMAFFAAAVLTALCGWLLPKRGGWDSLGDAVIIFFITGCLSFISAACGIISWNCISDYALFSKITTCISVVPAMLAIVAFVMMARK